LHERYPVRFWDHDLGPGQTRVFAADPLPAGADRYPDPRDLTPEPDGRIGDETLAISPDGQAVAYLWKVPDGPDGQRQTVVVAGTADGDRRLVVDDGEGDFLDPAFSPDGRWLACVREGRTTYDEPARCTLWLIDLETGEGRDATPAFPFWPHGLAFSADSAAVFFVADDHGHRPAFRFDLADGSVTRLTASGAYSDLAVAQDGSALYALRSAVDSPPLPVRLDPSAADQQPVFPPTPRPADRQPVFLPSPGLVDELPGSVVEVTTVADDGVPLRAWLCLPGEASAADPAPLLLWIHGGPLSSWNCWSWRWNPWLMVARGYAVL